VKGYTLVVCHLAIELQIKQYITVLISTNRKDNMQKSILKPSTSIISDMHTPKQQNPLFLPDNTQDVTKADVTINIDSADRKRAIAQYAINDAEVYMESSQTIGMGCASVCLFKRDDPPMYMQVPEEEPLVSGDLCNFFAARAVDILLGKAQRDSAEIVQMLGPHAIDTALEDYHKVADEPMTREELKDLMLQQLLDLEQRCEARLCDIAEKRQFSVKKLTNDMAVGAEYVSAEEELDFEEKILSRKPDVLTQRYLSKRIDSKIPGIDLNRNLLRDIRTLKAVLVRISG